MTDSEPPASAAPGWYVRDHIGGQARQVWFIDDRTARRAGVSDPEKGPGTFFQAEPGEDVWDCLRRLTPWLNPEVTEGRFHAMELGPAEYYPRIARPDALGDGQMPTAPNIDLSYAANSKAQLLLLVRRLENICLAVQPSATTLEVYGHEIRNLLILAATEAEMHWRGVLKANRADVKPRLTTSDYVKLLTPLKLGDYEIRFRGYPDLPPVLPFENWSPAEPTQSLPWYAAYHAVKHNREEEFERGTLAHAFSAVAACTAMFVAQFGWHHIGGPVMNTVAVQTPRWEVGEMYLPRVTDADLTAVPHPSL